MKRLRRRCGGSGLAPVIDAIAMRDFPMVQGSVLLVATLFVVVNLIVDIVYTFIDPRISYD